MIEKKYYKRYNFFFSFEIFYHFATCEIDKNLSEKFQI